MAKTKFFRVATSGATTDGRTIDAQTLHDMAATYNPETYQARVNIEHIKGYHPESGFGAYGDVLALKTEPVTLNVGGKDEQRVGLYAQIDALDPLVALKDKGQKLFSSIEVRPNFAGSGKAYLDALAFTDNPASLGTQMMKFAAEAGAASPLHFRKSDAGNIITEAEETTFDFAADPAADADKSMMDAIRRFFSGLGAPTAPAAPAPVVPAPTAPANLFADPAVQQAFTGIQQLMEKIATSNSEQTAALTRITADFNAHRADFATLQTQASEHATALAALPSGTFRNRAPSTGGGGERPLRADC